MTLKPGSANKPFFGVVPEVVRDDGSRANVNEGGYLIIDKPWPGMIRGTYGDPEHKRVKEVYFDRFPGKYFSGDGASVDEDGDFWIMGRIDDVVNVSGHRLGTAEIESALVSHEAVVEAAAVGYPCVYAVAPGTGKTCIGNLAITSGRLGKTFDILPTTLVTSGTLVTQFAIARSGSMATQQQPIADERSVEDIIWHVGTTLPLRYRVRLVSRLSELQKVVQEEEFGSHGISVRSLQHFVELLEAYPRLRCPALSLTPDRNIYASWKSGSDRVFSIHFLPDGEVRFVIFRPNDKHPRRTIRLSGTATVDVIMSIAEPHGVLDWASE